MNKIIQVLGTSSDSGKTTFAMALCRYFSNKGYKVSPFKAINMSLNSIALNDGSEISRAQWLQSVAARAMPSKYINPFLIKPEGNKKSQLIVLGKAIGSLTIEEYYKYIKKNGNKIIKNSLNELLKKYDIIIAEGAGSAAEINMYGSDYANIFVSNIYKTPAILISDIEKGGVFASLYGTVKLMEHKNLLKYMVINKMRGDKTLLYNGIEKLEKLLNKKVIGVIPYSNISLPGEDSLNYNINKLKNNKVCIIKYPYMENYSDFDPFYLYNIGFNYITEKNIDDLNNCDIIILPGSKMVSYDLDYIKKTGIYNKIIELSNNKKIIGICGGYQMLGKYIIDRNKIESNNTKIKGMGLLNIETSYNNIKKTDGVLYKLNSNIFGINDINKGYEIHYGDIINNNEKPMNYKNGMPEGSVKNNIMGTNIHGIFENINFLTYLFNINFNKYNEILDNNINKTAELFINNIDIKLIEDLIK